jgi:hypothetical protein
MPIHTSVNIPKNNDAEILAPVYRQSIDRGVLRIDQGGVSLVATAAQIGHDNRADGRRLRACTDDGHRAWLEHAIEIADSHTGTCGGEG